MIEGVETIKRGGDFQQQTGYFCLLLVKDNIAKVDVERKKEHNAIREYSSDLVLHFHEVRGLS